MSRSFAILAGVAAFGLILASGMETHGSAQSPFSTKNPSVSVRNANAKISNATLRTQRPHRLVIHVDVNDPAVMNLALNNVSNVAQHYSDLNQKVEIEVVAYGPGLHMLRDDTSPVKGRVAAMSETTPGLTFSACGNTRENMTKSEGKDIPLVSQAKVTKSGVVRLMELQEQGWSYLRP
ncbi:MULTISPECIES: DsrE family protein [unclassified Bradyrhizobium]|uniref:DsrE family protein n=1 Tax=unclassified Bradyrhizobium TaxID=2631580 RepID=UPI0024B1D72E|nr:DsrE family protein [Bradyrhizobium sp. CB2312]WFU69784.1 DsrE family protein [Bradyrhizobium sp. CB2312]